MTANCMVQHMAGLNLAAIMTSTRFTFLAI